MGASEADAVAALKAREPEPGEDFELWLENVESFEIFCALETQWHMVAGFAVARIGLRYETAIALMRERDIKRVRRVEILDDLRAMERAVLPVLNGREEDDG